MNVFFLCCRRLNNRFWRVLVHIEACSTRAIRHSSFRALRCVCVLYMFCLSFFSLFLSFSGYIWKMSISPVIRTVTFALIATCFMMIALPPLKGGNVQRDNHWIATSIIWLIGNSHYLWIFVAILDYVSHVNSHQKTRIVNIDDWRRREQIIHSFFSLLFRVTVDVCFILVKYSNFLSILSNSHRICPFKFEH